MQKYIDLLTSLIAIPSFSRDEQAASNYLESWLQHEGLPVHRKGNNVWCEQIREADDTRPTLLLNAHIDTVQPASGYTRNPFSAEIADGKIYGLGANDDGGSLIALLAVYEQLHNTPQPYHLIFSATAEEEVSGSGGLEMILPDLGHIDFAIIGEPTAMQMAVAEKGLMVLDCTAHGRSGHAARNEGDNALYHALNDVEWIKNYRFNKTSPFLGDVKMTVTQIQAGTQHNVIPDICTFVVDIRSNEMYSNAEILDIISANVKSDVKARSTRLNSSQLDINHPAVVRGKQLGLTCFGSPTTSNQAIVHFPTMKIGPGNSARSHTANEYISISELEQGIHLFNQLLNNLTFSNYETLGQRI
jgi:acetylornithine deacetylase